MANPIVDIHSIERSIFYIRHEKVILDQDLAVVTHHMLSRSRVGVE